MAKLEEISELLVSEINDFEEAVKRLEAVQNKKISIDLKEMKDILAQHKRELENQNSTAQSIYNLIEKLIKEAKIYPNWAVIVFIVSLLLNLVLIITLLKSNGSL